MTFTGDLDPQGDLEPTPSAAVRPGRVYVR